jgi:hypothetical protein
MIYQHIVYQSIFIYFINILRFWINLYLISNNLLTSKVVMLHKIFLNLFLCRFLAFNKDNMIFLLVMLKL